MSSKFSCLILLAGCGGGTATKPTADADPLAPDAVAADAASPDAAVAPKGVCTGRDANGGVPADRFPGAACTGVRPGTTLTPYTDSCFITSPVTLDARTIDCPGDLVIRAHGVVIQNSKITGHVVVDTDTNQTWTLSLVDVEVDASQGDLPAISSGNVTVLRANIHGGHNGLECQEHASFCSLHDSWIHDQWQAPTGDTHLGGLLLLGNAVPCTGTSGNLTGLCADLVHNTVVCDAPVNVSGGGCTGDINLIPHFGALPGALIQDNFLGANVGASYCTYGGAGVEHPASHIVYTGNVFQRGTNHQCAAYGPVTSFDAAAPGNVWVNNTWEDDGSPVEAEN